MTLTVALLDAAQGAGRALPSSPQPFSVLQLGKALYTLSFFTLVTLVVTAWAASGATSGGPRSRSRIDLGLFWGLFTLGVGLFHVFMSLTTTMRSVQLFGPIGPDQQWLVARAVMLGTLAGAWGTIVCLVAALAWLWNRRRADRAGAAPLVPA